MLFKVPDFDISFVKIYTKSAESALTAHCELVKLQYLDLLLKYTRFCWE